MHHFFQTCWHLMKNYILEDKFSLCRAVEIFFPFFFFSHLFLILGTSAFADQDFRCSCYLKSFPSASVHSNEIMTSVDNNHLKKKMSFKHSLLGIGQTVQVRSEPVPAPCPLQGTCPTAWHHQYPLPGLSLLLLLLQLR